MRSIVSKKRNTPVYPWVEDLPISIDTHVGVGPKPGSLG